MGSHTNSSVTDGPRRTWTRAFIASLLLSIAAAPTSTESAIANGDTRTILLSNQHTNESGAFTYMVNGYYDQAVLDKLNWFLRDWRLNEPTKMDPKLFDILWEVYRESGSQQPIDVLSGYRSPQTNAMLRRRSRQVAEHSQHMEGRAVDAHFIDVGTATIRDIAMRMQAGGVGFYPTGMTPWVHIDSGSVRYWPRMNRDALARLFPDGKTVFIPADGQPMAGYDQARAEIEARGGEVITASNQGGGGLFSWLFGGPRGGGADDAEEGGEDANPSAGRGKAGASGVQVASAGNDPLAAPSAIFPVGTLTRRRAATPRRPRPLPARCAMPAASIRRLPGDALAAGRRDPATVAAPAAAPEPQSVVARNSDAPADASVVSLHGPIADRFLAPLPPRKPAGLIEAAFVDAPLPPQRPAEFAVAAVEAAPEAAPPAEPKPAKGPSGNRDLIAALLERGRLPGVITKGLSQTPKDALALTETVEAPEPPERPEIMARAAALVAPLPPPRPVASEVCERREEPPAGSAPRASARAQRLQMLLTADWCWTHSTPCRPTPTAMRTNSWPACAAPRNNSGRGRRSGVAFRTSAIAARPRFLERAAF